MAAIVLEALGFSRQQVMDDYMLSAHAADRQLEVDRWRKEDGATGVAAGEVVGGATTLSAKAGKGPQRVRSSVFPGIMARTMSWLDSEHGGVVSWLASGGFDADDVAALKALLLLEPTPPPLPPSAKL